MSAATLAIIIALIAAAPPTLLALVTYRKLNTIHLQINSRMDELLRVSVSDATAKGRAQGIETERDKLH